MYNEKLTESDSMAYGIPVTVVQPQHVTAQPAYIPNDYNQSSTSPAQPSVYNQGMNNPPPGPPTGGKWRDGICDCFTNLWPSCGCAIMFYGIWIMSQMSQKSEFAPFRTILLPFMIFWLICFGISFAFPWVYILPGVTALILSLILRFHLIKRYQLNQTNGVIECLTGFFCFPCSVAQMARHVYGYRRVLDGDSDPELKDQYTSLQV